MELSKRLNAVAGLVTEGASVADIGTDHGYIPIYLAETGRYGKLIAMDINQGPIDRAREHIRMQGLDGKIQTRRSDGLQKLDPGEVDTMIAAGMGGNLIIHILEDASEVTSALKEFILQPQSEIHKVRAYLNEHGFKSVAEDMVEEEGKFYPVMKLVHGTEKMYSEEELYYGRILLEQKHPVLAEFLRREEMRTAEILRSLPQDNGGRILRRREELEHELTRIRTGIRMCERRDAYAV